MGFTCSDVQENVESSLPSTFGALSLLPRDVVAFCLTAGNMPLVSNAIYHNAAQSFLDILSTYANPKMEPNPGHTEKKRKTFNRVGLFSLAALAPPELRPPPITPM
jgi:hypothetical protein